ncbi:HAMP domain-containing protein [bacterium]|nr:HAMP domain-containing protein [bacterium]
MSSRRRKLRNLWLNSRFQGRYIRALVGSSFLVMLGYGFVFYKHIKENYDTLVKLSPVTDEVKSELYRELNQIVLYLSGFSLLFLLSVALIGLVYSHRVAGPLFKIKVVCKDICDGNTSARIALRPNDEFRDVAEQLNQLIDVLQKKNS